MSSRSINGELTPREISVLRLASYGLNEHETGEKMHLAHNTVKYYRGTAMRKLDAKNITHAVALAYETGVFKSDV